jgi:hypothetical protein
MAQTGFTPIQIYSSSTTGNTPAAADLLNSSGGSELAINIFDGKLFYKDSSGNVQVIGWKVVPVSAGGTGQTSYTDGQLLIGNSTGNTLAKSTLTAGTGISITNGAGAITISATGGTGDVVGPASATDNAIARFDTTTGKLIQNSVATISDAGILATDKELVGSNANFTDFPNAQAVFSQANTGSAHIYNIGVAGEGVATDVVGAGQWGVGVYGTGATAGATRGIGVVGDGHVGNTADTAAAIGVRGYSTNTHSGGQNIGLYSQATGGASNYSLFMASGNIYSAVTQTWAVPDNESSALSIDTTGKAGILKIVTTNAAEKVTMSGGLDVTGTTTLATSLSGLAKLTSGVVSTATSGTDYAPATSGTSILYGNGSGGFSNVTIGTGVSFAAGTLSATGSGGTVTSVAALTLGTSGTDLSSTVANGTTTPVITLNVPTASATNRGALSAADWTTFNNKQPAGTYVTNLTGPITSVGNATSIASQTGTGTTFAMSASPTFTGTVGAADLTTTGNTILGNASTDTLNVGNGDLIKDASGNIGIGITPSAWSNGKAIEVAAKGNGFWSYGAADSRLTCNMYYNGGFFYATTNPAGQYYISGNVHSWHNAPSGSANAALSFTQAMTLDASSNLSVTGYSKTASYFYAAGTVSGNNGLYLGAGSAAGCISQTSQGPGTVTTYIGNAAITAVSDERLKENIVDTARNGLDLINQLRVVDHTWNDPSDQCENNRNSRGVWMGLIAQEAQPIIPWLVNKPLADVNEDGTINPWVMDFGYAVPLLVKAIQEQQALITNLTARLDTQAEQIKVLQGKKL